MTRRSQTACALPRLLEDWRLTGCDGVPFGDDNVTGVLTPSGAAGVAGVAAVNSGPSLGACGCGLCLGPLVAPLSTASRAERPTLLATPSGKSVVDAQPAVGGVQLGQGRSAATGDATAEAVALKQCPAAAARSGKPVLPQVGHT